jgi:cell wall-associated NlpC family hydrolase
MVRSVSDVSSLKEKIRQYRLPVLSVCLSASVFCGTLMLQPQPSWALPSQKVNSIIRTAQTQLGTPYRSGGGSPETGFDCSGFVSWVLGKNGIVLGRSSGEHFKHGKKITRGDLKPGDLVFFSSNRKKKRVAHVGIYLGANQFIHAASNNRQIQVNGLYENYWSKHYMGARRI